MCGEEEIQIEALVGTLRLDLGEIEGRLADCRMADRFGRTADSSAAASAVADVGLVASAGEKLGGFHGLQGFGGVLAGDSWQDGSFARGHWQIGCPCCGLAIGFCQQHLEFEQPEGPRALILLELRSLEGHLYMEVVTQ